MPEGGKVMIFVGRLDQDNAVRRRTGFIDGLFGNESDATHNYPASEEVVSGDKKFTILGTITDNFDKAKAKANVEDAVTRNPNIDGMVGLFGYNPPLILEALDRVHKLGKIKVMAFDEDSGTLQGIKDGNVVATTVQNPYQYGYQSVKVLNELHNGNKSVIPESKFIDIPARDYSEERRRILGGSQKPSSRQTLGWRCVADRRWPDRRGDCGLSGIERSPEADRYLSFGL